MHGGPAPVDDLPAGVAPPAGEAPTAPAPLPAPRWVLALALGLLVWHLAGRSRLNAHLGLHLISWDAFLLAETFFVGYLARAWSPHPPLVDDEQPEGPARWIGPALVGLPFFAGFRLHEATNYPLAYDQLGLLDHLYTIVDRVGLEGWSALLSLPTLKGMLLELTGFLCLLLLGVSRSSVALANILFFVGLVVALHRYFEAHGGRLVARAAVGILLLGESVYLTTGGVRDLRWDAAGLASYGCFVLALAHLLERPDRRALRLALAAAAATVMTRSITAVYVAATLAGCLGWELVAGLGAGFSAERRVRLRHLVWTGLSAGAAGLVLAAFRGRELATYYGQHSLSAEGQARLTEFGLRTRWDLPAFYASSLREHAGLILVLTGVLAAAGTVSGLLARRRGAPSIGLSYATPLRVGVLGFLGAFCPLLATLPSPVVVGVVTGPLVLLAGTLFARATARTGLFGSRRADLANLLLLVGVVSLIVRATRPSDQIQWRVRLELGARVARSMDELVRALPTSGGPVVLWLAIDEGLNWGVFNVRLHEQLRSKDARRVQHYSIALMDRRGPQALAETVAGADAVIAPAGWGLRVGPFPAVNTIRAAEPAWRPILERSFCRISRVSGMALEYEITAYDVWVRAVSLGEVAGIVAPGEPGQGYLWAGAVPARIEVLNRAAEGRTAELRCLVEPPPGIFRARFAIRSRSGTQRFDLSRERGWELRAPLEAPPGTSEVELALEHQEPPGDNVHWWTLQDLRLR